MTTSKQTTTKRTTTGRTFGPDECPTKQGNVCRFPFESGGRFHNHCIPGGPQGLICKVNDNVWEACSTETKYMDACERKLKSVITFIAIVFPC